MMNNLIGKAVLLRTTDGYRTGEIVDAIGADSVVVQFDCMDKRNKTEWQWPMEIVSVAELAGLRVGETDNRAWGLFHNRDDLAKFVRWLDSPTPKTRGGGSISLARH